MNRIVKLVVLAVSLSLMFGCATYYLQSNLNGLSVGISKSAFLYTFPDTRTTQGPILRAAQKGKDGLIEVFTMEMTGGQLGQQPVPFWFLFENGSLTQWGRPEDWRNVSASYEINFNPAHGVR
ncbi:MAG: hypothetical protein AB1724_12255 [Thermodesulfobacteriota bacterium]